MEIHAVKSWFDQHHGLVELEDDVLGIVQRIKELGQGRLHVYYNEQTEGFDLVETCLDHTDRLVFSVDALDQRVVDRLLRADHWGSEDPNHRESFRSESEDFASLVDRHNDQLLADLDEASMERVMEAGERLAWALGEDGRGVNSSISVPRSLADGDDSPGVG